MEHVGVAEHDIRGATQRARGPRRVPVVDGRHDCRGRGTGRAYAPGPGRAPWWGRGRGRAPGGRRRRSRGRRAGSRGSCRSPSLYSRRRSCRPPGGPERRPGDREASGTPAARSALAQRGRQLRGEVGGASAPRCLVRHGDDLVVPTTVKNACSARAALGVMPASWSTRPWYSPRERGARAPLRLTLLMPRGATARSGAPHRA